MGNCRLPPEVVLFLQLEWNGGELSTCTIHSHLLPFSSFHSLFNQKQLWEIKLLMVTTILVVWFADFRKALTIIQWSSQLESSDK